MYKKHRMIDLFRETSTCSSTKYHCVRIYYFILVYIFNTTNQGRSWTILKCMQNCRKGCGGRLRHSQGSEAPWKLIDFSRFYEIDFHSPQCTDIMWWIYVFFTLFKYMFTMTLISNQYRSLDDDLGIKYLYMIYR